MTLDTHQLILQAVEAHQNGELQVAETKYREILKSDPLHPGANHNLGVLAMSVNKPDEAMHLFKIALNSNPKVE